MQSKVKLLLIDGNESVAKVMTDFLEIAGFKIDVSLGALESLNKLSSTQYSLVMINLNLPYVDGLEMLKQITTHQSLPIIALNDSDCIETKLEAFRLGVDDYLCKPFVLEELEARIRAVLKRSSVKVDLTPEKLSVDYNEHVVNFNNEPLPLTAIEYKILSFLIENKNRVVNRDVLATHLSTLSSAQSLNYHIQNIRKKLRDDSKKPRHIVTEYGLGYRLIS